MKTKNILSILLGAVLLASSLVSCEKADYPDRFRPTPGVPEIYSIEYAATGVYTEQAYMEEVICILGNNLCSIHDIWFNDQQAILNTSYITNNTLLVQIPKTMPEVTTDKIYFRTADSVVVTYDFRVLPPVPKVNFMKFEYAEPGTVTTIYGNFFYQKEDSPLIIEFPNAIVTDIKEIELDHVTFTVPEGALPGKVKVTTASGTSSSDFYYKDSRGLLFDFDGTNGLYTINKGWHAADVVAGGVSGNCLQLCDGTETFTADGKDWHDGKCHFEYWAGNWQDPETYGDWDGRRLCDIVDFTDFVNMSIKFELKIDADHAWTGCPMQIIFSDVTLVSNGNAGVVDIYGNVLGGCNNTYVNDATVSLPRYLWRPWADTGSFDTGGEWQTITVPFSSFNMFWDGSLATGRLTPESFANLELFFAAGTESEGTPCQPIFKIDNIRAVSNK